jgi:aspartate/methionine/tyrosine aminotransferase
MIRFKSAMTTGYLSWYKDLEVKLYGSTEDHVLLSSAVNEPTAMLQRHLQQFQQQQLSKQLGISNAWGHPALIKSIAARYGVAEQRVATTNGVSNGIYLLCRALLSKDDHVVIESPVYEPLIAAADIVGARITYIKRKSPEYYIDPDDLKRSIKPGTALLIISNLHNPSGALLTDDQLKALAQIAQQINPTVKIAVDEVYHDFTFGAQAPAATLDDCFISLNSLTKVYGLGCVHTGWILADRSIIEKVKRLQLLVEGSGAKLLEGFASFIIENLDEYWDRAVELVSNNRQILVQYLKPLVHDGILSGTIPAHGCIYFPKVANADDTQTLVKLLAEKYRVFVVPGHFFGEPKHVRMGFGAATEKLQSGLERLTGAVHALAEQPGHESP